MQPTSEQSHLPPPPPPPNPPGQYAPGQYPPGTHPPSATATSTVTKTARPWRVATVAFVSFLVLIAGLGNQWVIDAIFRHRVSDSFWDNAARALGTYQWRFRPAGGHDHARVWLGSLTLVGSALVLTLLVVAVVARGRGGFGQTLFATWMTVLFATVLATYARAAVLDAKALNIATDGKPAFIVFSQISPNSYQVAAGLGVGLIVGLCAGLTASLSRRTEVIGAPPAPTGFVAPDAEAPYPQASYPQASYPQASYPEASYPPVSDPQVPDSHGPDPHMPDPSPGDAIAHEPWPSPPAAQSPWVKQPDTTAATNADQIDDQIDDHTQRTAVLPVVDAPTQSDETQLPRSSYVAGDPADRTALLPRLGTEYPSRQAAQRSGPTESEPQNHDPQNHDPQNHDPQNHDPQNDDPHGHAPQQDEPPR